MPLEPLEFGGLASLFFDERTPLTLAQEAKDCYVDKAGIQGRNGYRRAVTDSLATSSGGGGSSVSATLTPALSFPVAYASNAFYGSPTGYGYYLFDVAIPAGFTCTSGYWDYTYRVTFDNSSGLEGNGVGYTISGSPSDGPPQRVGPLTVGMTYSEHFAVGSFSSFATVAAVIAAAAGGNLHCTIAFAPSVVSIITVDILSMSLTLTGTFSGATPPGWGSGGGAPQALARFRPDDSSARCVEVAGGSVFVSTDPSSETAIDGMATGIGFNKFSASARISLAQMGKYCYIGTDEAGVLWQRVRPDFTLEALSGLTKGVAPTFTLSTLAVQKFNSGTFSGSTAVAGGASSVVATDYYQVAGADGCGYYWTWAADQNMTPDNWLMVVVSPPTLSDGGGAVTISLATAAGAFEKVGEISDTAGDGAPCIIYVSLASVSAATRAAVRRIQFIRNGGTTPFLVHGVMAIPSAPGAGPQTYSVTFYNSVTKQESAPTDDVTVTFDSSLIVIPAVHIVRRNYSTYKDEGNQTADPDVLPPNVCFNKSGGIAIPSRYEFASVPTFSGNVPTASQSPLADKVRLYRVTPTGTRIVKEVANVGTTYTITDDAGTTTDSRALFVAGGAAPRCVALAASGRRLIAGGDPSTPNRLYISNYLPQAQDAEPFPQFPPVTTGTDLSEGWAFDIAQTAAEQILAIWHGDSDYILTNERVYSMHALTPNSIPREAAAHGLISRRGAIWAGGESGEGALYWASHDGIYVVNGYSAPIELTGPRQGHPGIKRYYQETHLPDSTTMIGYQDRKLYCVTGTRAIRYDFVTGSWTRHVLAHTNLHPACWRDPNGTIFQFWMFDSDGYLNRWQATATSDAGTAIPTWVYKTGFEAAGVKTRLRTILLDASGAVTVNAYKDTGTTGPNPKAFASGEHELPFSPIPTAYKWCINFAGANGVSVKRAMWDRTRVAAKGG